jgi:hypothetical protein
MLVVIDKTGVIRNVMLGAETLETIEGAVVPLLH